MASADIPSGVDFHAVRPILGTARHRERSRWMVVGTRQDDGLQRAATEAVTYRGACRDGKAEKFRFDDLRYAHLRPERLRDAVAPPRTRC